MFYIFHHSIFTNQGLALTDASILHVLLTCADRKNLDLLVSKIVNVSWVHISLFRDYYEKFKLVFRMRRELKWPWSSRRLLYILHIHKNWQDVCWRMHVCTLQPVCCWIAMYLPLKRRFSHVPTLLCTVFSSPKIGLLLFILTFNWTSGWNWQTILYWYYLCLPTNPCSYLIMLMHMNL